MSVISHVDFIRLFPKRFLIQVKLNIDVSVLNDYAMQYYSETDSKIVAHIESGIATLWAIFLLILNSCVFVVSKTEPKLTHFFKL